MEIHKSMDIKSLPKYIILKILFDLSIKQLFRTKRVCKYFYDLITLENIDVNYKNLTSIEFKWFHYLFARYIAVDKNISHHTCRILSKLKSIDWDIIRENRHIKWDLKYIVRNPNISVDIIMNNPYFNNVNFSQLSKNPNITMEYIYEEDWASWDYSVLSNHPNITWEHVLSNQDKPWNYSLMSENPNITWEHVVANPDVLGGWDFGLLSKNPNITIDHILNNPEVPGGWDCWELSKNPNITWDDIVNNPDLPGFWDYQALSRHPNITWDIVQNNFDQIRYGENMQRGWDFYELSKNPNVTLDIVRANSNAGAWNYIQIMDRLPREIALNTSKIIFNIQKNNLIFEYKNLC